MRDDFRLPFVVIIRDRGCKFQVTCWVMQDFEKGLCCNTIFPQLYDAFDHKKHCVFIIKFSGKSIVSRENRPAIREGPYDVDCRCQVPLIRYLHKPRSRLDATTNQSTGTNKISSWLGFPVQRPVAIFIKGLICPSLCTGLAYPSGRVV